MAFMELAAKVSLDGSAVATGLRKIQSSVASARASLNSLGGNQITQAFGVAAVIQFARSTMELGGTISDTAKRLGMSAEEVQKWNFAATQSGAKIEDVTQFFDKLSKAKKKAMEGDAKMIRNFKELGVSVDDLRKKSLSDIGLQIGGTVREGDAQALTSALTGVGGRSAGTMIAPMKSGLETAFAAAPVMSNEQIEKMDEAGDRIDEAMLRLREPMATVIEWAVFFFEKMMDGFALIKATASDFYRFIFAAGFDVLAMFKGDFSRANLKDAVKESEVDALAAEWLDREKAAEARKLAKEAAAKVALPDEAEESPAVAKAVEQTQRIQRDSLAQIGGFTFARDQEIINVAKAQVDLLSKISQNTEQLKKFEPVTDGL